MYKFMSFLSDLHEDNSTQIAITKRNNTHIDSKVISKLAEYNTSCILQTVTNVWELDLTHLPINDNVTSTLFKLIERNFQLTRTENYPIRLTGFGDFGYIIETVCKKLQLVYGCKISSSDRCIIIDNTNPNDVITEEHNTSLMYHKLFPNSSLLRDLESFGYKFEMGAGLKLHKQFYASKHRNKSAPTKQRTIQTLIIFKNGQMFRQIPKSQWVMLVDPSDVKSKTWGEVFMKKLLSHEQQSHQQKLQQANS